MSTKVESRCNILRYMIKVPLKNCQPDKRIQNPTLSNEDTTNGKNLMLSGKETPPEQTSFRSWYYCHYHYHYRAEHEGVCFTMLDMAREGRYDMVEILG